MTAPTMQDGINAAVKDREEGVEGGREGRARQGTRGTRRRRTSDKIEVGTKIIKTPSGIGFVATGIGAYRMMENPTPPESPSARPT